MTHIIKSAGVGSGTPALVGTLSDDYKKVRLGQDLVTGRVYGSIAGGLAFAGATSIMAYVIQKNWKSFEGRDGQAWLSNLATNIATIMWDVQKFYFSNTFPTRPAVILASIPLGTVTEVSHAMSQRDLKFRAVGGVFLADQEGGEESLRIVGKAWGKNRFVFLQMLDTLFEYGSAKTVDLFTEYLKSEDALKDPHLTTAGLEKTLDPWEDFNHNGLNEGQKSYRATFPVITRQKIYANMFIETYEYTESVDNGIDVVEYVLFLRKYVQTPPMQFDRVSSGSTEKPTDKWYVKVENDDELYQRTQHLDVVLGFGLSAAMILYRMIVYQQTGKFSFLENLASRFGVALNRTIDGETDPYGEHTSEYTTGEKEELFGYTPCEGLTGTAYEHCMLGAD